MARTIEAFKLRTEVAVDAAKGRRDLQATEKDVGKVGDRFKKLGKEINDSMRGTDVAAGRKFGQNFGAGATASIVGSIKSLGTTLGSVIGTAIAPGIGTAIGSTVGSAVDLALGKLTGPILETIKGGIELNKQLEETLVEYTTFTGSKQAGLKYLAQLTEMSTDNGLRLGVLLDASERVRDFGADLELTNKIMQASIEQAADFGGSEASFRKVADALGLIVEKGELSSREIQKLYRLGIDVPKRLAEATGKSQEFIKKMIAQNRIDGALAAQAIADSILREKAGFARKLAETTTAGAERRFGTLTELRAAEGTREATRGLGDFYRQANIVLDSPQAQQFVRFIDEKTGSLINMVEKASRAGINVAQGIGTGVTSPEALQSLGSSFTSLGSWTEKTLKGVFEIESPSERTKRQVGIPIGLGIGAGTGIGMEAYAREHAETDVERFIRIYAEAAIEAMKKTGVPASVSLAQAIIESGVGKSGLTKRANNFFGIKGRGPAGSVTMRTREETRSGQSYYVNAPFRAYNNPTESFMDHAQFLLGPRYRGALRNAGDPKRYAQDIASAGYATDRNYAQTLGRTIDRYGLSRFDVAANGALISDGNPLPVKFVGLAGGAIGRGGTHDPLGGASRIFGEGAQARPFGQDLKETMVVLDDADGAVVDVKVGMQELIKDGLAPGTLAFNQLMNGVTLTLRPIEALIGVEKEHAETSIELTDEYMKAMNKMFTAGQGIVSRLSGMLGQVSGMVPSQEVGKKRGFFSKLLGVAAPFLSFIPGVGPILSAVAGIASSALAGDYGGALSGVAGGLQSGGVFRRSANSSPSPSTSTRPRTLTQRAFGGPVRRGNLYLVGEHRPEIYEPRSDGYVHPSADSAGGGFGYGAQMERLASVIESFERRIRTMRPHDVVAMGGRGMLTAMGRDADLIRYMGRKQRLA